MISYPIEVRGLAAGYAHGRDFREVLHDISFGVRQGELLAIVGESGSGKSTLGRCLVGLHPLQRGDVLVTGISICRMNRYERMEMHRQVQMVFQDPFSSFDPRQTIGDAIMEPLVIHRKQGRRERIGRCHELLLKVGLEPDMMRRLPRSFSGGQLQRMAIARALALGPKVIIADEPVSSLDVSIQAQVLQLFSQLQQTEGISIIFIGHDLSVIRQIADRMIVLEQGNIVEQGETENVCTNPQAPYTKLLIDHIPKPASLCGLQ